jgi:hypothetical protein
VKIRTPMRPKLVLPQAYRTKVMLGYPYGGGLTGPFHKALGALERYELSKDPQDRLLTHELPVQGLYIADNRNRIAKEFLKTDCTWLLQIDSDISFPETLIESMVSLAGSDKKVLAASVPLGAAFASCAFLRTTAQGQMLPPGVWSCVPSELIGVEPIECDGLATAVILIHRDVLEAIARAHGQCWFHHIYVPKDMVWDAERGEWLMREGVRPEDVEYLSQGEDLAFCARAALCGYKLWCARVPGLKHHKTLPMSHDHEVPEGDEGVRLVGGVQ